MGSTRHKIVQNLSAWFRANSRTLPWRESPDPYSIWLSEIMLQQTQVATVISYFERFKQAFPMITDLANAPLDEVLKLWAGLGYYSRARNLHDGALSIAARIAEGHGFPKNRHEWLEIPGVGDYTAGAICSIALNQTEAIVDGNVVRVLSRLNAWQKLDSKKSQIWIEARALVEQPGVEPRVFNQALMELGALICKPKNPKCLICPVAQQCRGKDQPELYPDPKPKTVWKHLHEQKLFWTRKNTLNELEIYLEKNGDQGWRQGLWDFPNYPEDLESTEHFNTKSTVTVHKILRSHHVHQEMRADLSKIFKKGQWFSSDDLPAVPSPVKKAIREFQSR